MAKHTFNPEAITCTRDDLVAAEKVLKEYGLEAYKSKLDNAPDPIGAIVLRLAKLIRKLMEELDISLEDEKPGQKLLNAMKLHNEGNYSLVAGKIEKILGASPADTIDLSPKVRSFLSNALSQRPSTPPPTNNYNEQRWRDEYEDVKSPSAKDRAQIFRPVTWQSPQKEVTAPANMDNDTDAAQNNTPIVPKPSSRPRIPVHRSSIPPAPRPLSQNQLSEQERLQLAAEMRAKEAEIMERYRLQRQTSQITTPNNQTIATASSESEER